MKKKDQGQNGMLLPKGLYAAKPGALWKIMKVLKEEGPASHKIISARMHRRWKYYPYTNRLCAILSKRQDVFILVNIKDKIYDLKDEWKDVMD